MTPENKLGITSDVELAREEERLTKLRALELYDMGLLDTFEVGTFAGLAKIHGYLFQDVYEFAGEPRTVNISKGSFRFASVMYLGSALRAIDKMPQSTFDQIVEKYVEMNVAHPFREGNGRSARIWLDCMLKSELGVVVDWNRVDREDYLLAMERSPVRDREIKFLLNEALTDAVADRRVYMKGIDASYRYEGYATYSMDELDG
ncbi:cell filamentation protein Fic [Olsenella sp. SW781]|uniref:protein adenylyltransferase Fic n=1 Tax=Olsenella sp. SW781 TaxID=2530046 RepID=UPI001438EFE1|nr:Fic family protein [Olsenella sp. SW781]NJE80367.1 cell filamentation protein Fic [Olsenella sp. SW781]